MSGGKSSSQTSSPFAGVLASIAEQVNQEVDPIRQQFLGQLSSILSGNLMTPGAIPLIQSGVNAARQAGSNALASTQKYLAQTGVGNSPFAAAIMSLVNQQGTANVGNVPLQVAEQFEGQIPGAASGFTNSSISGLSSAMQGNMSTNSSNNSLDLGGLLTGFGVGLGSAIF